MGIEGLADQPVGQLSGGQLQRAFIARALAPRPKVLVLDEPTTGIDRVGQDQFVAFLRGLKAELGLTVVFVSHDLRTVAGLSDRVACLNVTLHYHDAPDRLPAELAAEFFGDSGGWPGAGSRPGGAVYRAGGRSPPTYSVPHMTVPPATAVIPLSAVSPDALILVWAVATACAVLSVFVVLLKWAFIGEGISHAGVGGAGTAAVLSLGVPALGGDAAGYAVAVLFCFATAAAIGWVSRRRGVSGDAAIGVFVVASLAWGAVAFAVRQHARGPGAEAGWDAYLLGSLAGVTGQSTLAGVGVCAAVLVVAAAMGRPILLYCFDPVLAEVSGVPVAFVHYLLVFLLAVVIVAGMKLLGNLLAPAMLILPGALALTLSVRLRTVLAVAVGSTWLAVAAGMAATARWPFVPAGPAVVLALFAQFAVATLFRRRR